MSRGSDVLRNKMITAITDAARAWADPEYLVRRHAEEKTLCSLNRFTGEALGFAIDQQMSLLREDSLKSWIPGFAAESRTVGVLNPGNIPFVGLQDLLAVILCGHVYRGVNSSRSPFLLSSFADDILARLEQKRAVPIIEFLDLETILEQSEALIASGQDDTIDRVRGLGENAGLATSHMLLRGSRYSVGLITGRESQAARDGLAEDMLMHEGLGCRNISLIWAPQNTSPDPFLDSMAAFRGVFPVHPDTAGSLQMTKAFLKAIDQPNAHGAGLEFILSKGDPEPQMPGHIRWVEYEVLSEAHAWIQLHRKEIQLLISAEKLPFDVPSCISAVQPGEAQRPPLGWCADGIDTVQFLMRL